MSSARAAAAFDRGYAAIAASARHGELFSRALGLPPEVAANSFLTAEALDDIAEALGVGAGDRLADLGCGRGGPGLWLARRLGAALDGVDFSAVAVWQAGERAQGFGLADRSSFRVGDLCDTGLPSGRAGAAVCVDAFHFAADHDAEAAEAWRILRPGGRYVLTNWEPVAADDARVPPPLRLDFARILTAAGFRAVTVSKRPDLEAAQRALFAAVLATEPGDDPAIRALRAEAAAVDGWAGLMRRVLVVAEKPA